MIICYSTPFIDREVPGMAINVFVIYRTVDCPRSSVRGNDLSLELLAARFQVPLDRSTNNNVIHMKRDVAALFIQIILKLPAPKANIQPIHKQLTITKCNLRASTFVSPYREMKCIQTAVVTTRIFNSVTSLSPLLLHSFPNP